MTNQPNKMPVTKLNLEDKNQHIGRPLLFFGQYLEMHYALKSLLAASSDLICIFAGLIY